MFNHRKYTSSVGDIQLGEKVVIEFKVRFSSDDVKNDAEYTIEAIAKSDNYKDISAKAPTVTRTNPTALTGMHNKIIIGTTLGDDSAWEWWPNYSNAEPHKAMSFQEDAAIIGRVLIMDKRGEIWTISIPSRGTEC